MKLQKTATSKFTLSCCATKAMGSVLCCAYLSDTVRINTTKTQNEKKSEKNHEFKAAPNPSVNYEAGENSIYFIVLKRFRSQRTAKTTCPKMTLGDPGYAYHTKVNDSRVSRKRELWLSLSPSFLRIICTTTTKTLSVEHASTCPLWGNCLKEHLT